MRYDHNEYMKEWRKRQPNYKAYQKNASLKHHYGITLKQYEEMLEGQGGCCAICATIAPDGYSLHVDHDHKTGIIRGLLCSTCNTGIGHFKDDPELLMRAAEYLK